jgi:CRISPR-associated DxTHG motif protein
MRRVYISFLGLGQYIKEEKIYKYHPTVYELNGKKSSNTSFVQLAELEILGASTFDAIFIAATEKSRDTHFKNLESQARALGASLTPIVLDEDLRSEGQWAWFESILSCIEPGDRLTIDLTHGYRSIPIVFSAAVNFLEKARNISLEAVYYGVYEKIKEMGYAPIMDMKDFYLINEWADGVSRLIEDADARKLGAVAERTTDFQAGELKDDNMIKIFDDLTNSLRNVEINKIGSKANYAIKMIENKKTTASSTGKILLDLVIDKFIFLTTALPSKNQYDSDYFKLQIEIIRLLIAHKLFMQAYTVMREFIASIGLIGVKKAKVDSNAGRKLRKRFGEIFVKMVQYDEENWAFGVNSATEKGRAVEQADKDWDSLIPFYQKLKCTGVINELRTFVKDLADYRNGFDHAWTAKPQAFEDIEQKGKYFLSSLEKTLFILNNADIFS